MAASTVALTNNPSPSQEGQYVALVATVTPASPVPTGTITFSSDIDGTLAIVTMSGGKASLQVDSLTPTTHTLTAAYSGDGNYTGNSTTQSQTVANFSPGSAHFTGSSDMIPQVVDPKGLAIENLASSLDPSLHGDDITFTITVKSASIGTPTGTVTLHDSLGGFPDQVLSLVPIAGLPTASYDAGTGMSIGSHTITATYNGDLNFDPVVATLIQLVLTPKGALLFDLPGFAMFAGYSGAGDTNLPSWASFTAVPDSCPAGTPVYILWTSNNVVAVEITEISGSPPFPPVYLPTGGSGIYEFPNGFATSTLLLCTGFDSLGNAVATENVLITIT
jgi:hypothetical protein